MAPLPPKEPYLLLKNEALLDARKFRFEINQIELPIGVKGSFGMIKHPGASLAVPITDDGHILLLRQYRFQIRVRR